MRGAGRTDAGVHALGQVAHFDDRRTRIPLHGFLRGLNAVLPRAIAIVAVDEVAARLRRPLLRARQALPLQHLERADARAACATATSGTCAARSTPPRMQEAAAARSSGATTSPPSAPPTASARRPTRTLRRLDGRALRRPRHRRGRSRRLPQEHGAHPRRHAVRRRARASARRRDVQRIARRRRPSPSAASPPRRRASTLVRVDY